MTDTPCKRYGPRLQQELGTDHTALLVCLPSTNRPSPRRPFVQKRRAGLSKSPSRRQSPFLSLTHHSLSTHLLRSVLFALDLGLGPYAEESSTNTGSPPPSLWTLRGGEAVRFISGCRICLFSPNEETALEPPTRMPFLPRNCSYSVSTTYVTMKQSRALTHYCSPCAGSRTNRPNEYTTICMETRSEFRSLLGLQCALLRWTTNLRILTGIFHHCGS